MTRNRLRHVLRRAQSASPVIPSRSRRTTRTPRSWRSRLVLFLIDAVFLRCRRASGRLRVASPHLANREGRVSVPFRQCLRRLPWETVPGGTPLSSHRRQTPLHRLPLLLVTGPDGLQRSAPVEHRPGCRSDRVWGRRSALHPLPSRMCLRSSQGNDQELRAGYRALQAAGGGKAASSAPSTRSTLTARSRPRVRCNGRLPPLGTRSVARWVPVRWHRRQRTEQPRPEPPLDRSAPPCRPPLLATGEARLPSLA